MSSVTKSLFGDTNKNAQQSAQGAALASMLAREGEANREVGASGSPRRRRGRQLLTYLNDDAGQASLN
ncbi:Uncharacterised protein [Starkeya nomas]|uniref:Uncharacterized protein n=1 Tax=Starkeya nomas TaxID=2666134 RepID=A0A5S9NZF8_9HYPH|nr:hypothetical protein [Starkeya nomas]CAA0096206.1 Uncharacterised protein [Starkeya nomas]